ncbi:cysteine desulfurase family protein [Propylenella binzhouense]|uniref:Cysteine desulfurase n=1 Tax=Propylenella binzhouense TaxID=2555902 RepID=A0A964WSP8_9HYPH|nr:cysteine desulfurase family protein [Propylenella binzhouense]MYZ47194.1 cysteine desulfurase [Propylenella binzhouense]
MREARIYFDANAGVPLTEEARSAVIAALGVCNPSSVHAEGRSARHLVEQARSAVAALAGARPDAVTFTSGATEAAVHALAPVILDGSRESRVGALYVGATEHPCVLAGGRIARGATRTVPVDRSGVADLAALEAMLRDHGAEAGVPLVALMLANNETGVVHPIAEAAAIVKRYGGYLLCDAVQGAGRLHLDIRALGADFLTISAHKIGGPQGAGALVLADEAVRPAPLLSGGGQERRRRAGTENVAAVAGFGVAAQHARHHISEAGRIASLRSRLEAGLRTVAPGALIMGETAERIPNTTLFAVPGIAAETAVIAFDLEGVAVSAGAACSSGKVAESHVLRAMGFDPELARAGIRVSLPFAAGQAEVDEFVGIWGAIHARLRPVRAA